MKCNVCGQEIKAGSGTSFWNMITGFQADTHTGACEQKYKNTSATCCMKDHEYCDGVAYVGNDDRPCACDCHKEKNRG